MNSIKITELLPQLRDFTVQLYLDDLRSIFHKWFMWQSIVTAHLISIFSHSLVYISTSTINIYVCRCAVRPSVCKVKAKYWINRRRSFVYYIQRCCQHRKPASEQAYNILRVTTATRDTSSRIHKLFTLCVHSTRVIAHLQDKEWKPDKRREFILFASVIS